MSEANRLLQAVKVQSLNSPSTMLFEQEKELLQKWQFLRSIEESYFKQRSRIMGVRNLEIWNKACMLKLIWLLFFKAGSIWVAWFTETVLNGDLNSFYTVKLSTQNSWLVNKLLKLRSEIYDWIKLRVRNGETCHFWTDNWSTFGCLRSFLANDLNSTLGI